jgi:hypothetical protein
MTQIWILIFVVIVAGATPGLTDSSGRDRAIVGRLSSAEWNSILARAQAEQLDTGLSADLLRDGRALAAALTTFQKSFSGWSGTLRNLKKPSVAHDISELTKRLGKEMIPKEPSDLSAMASAAEDCIAYLSSPSLVSYMEPDVARATRDSADSILQKMDAQTEAMSGIALSAVLTATKRHLSESSIAAANRAQIPVELDSIRAIESALDQGNVKLAIDGWTKLLSAQLVPFRFSKEYIDGNRSLFADLKHYDACKSPLSGLTSAQTKVAHVQALMMLRECRASAAGKPNTTAYLDSVEPSINQTVRNDFGTLPTDADLQSFLSSYARAVQPQAVAPPRQPDRPTQQSATPASQPETSQQEPSDGDETSETAAEPAEASSDSQDQPAESSSSSEPTPPVQSTPAPQSEPPASAPVTLSFFGFPLWLAICGGVVVLLGGWWWIARRSNSESEPARAGSFDPEVEASESEPYDTDSEDSEWTTLGKRLGEYADNRGSQWAPYLASDAPSQDAKKCLLLDVAMIAATFCHSDFDDGILSLNFFQFLSGFENRMGFLNLSEFKEAVGGVWIPHSLRAAAECDRATGTSIGPALAGLVQEWVAAVVDALSSSTTESCVQQVAEYRKAIEPFLHPKARAASAGAGASGFTGGQAGSILEQDCNLLGLSSKFTLEELSATRRRMAAQWHPDKLAGMAPELKQYAGQQLARINEACDRLKSHAQAPDIKPDALAECNLMVQMMHDFSRDVQEGVAALKANGHSAIPRMDALLERGDKLCRKGLEVVARIKREAPQVDVSILEQTVANLESAMRMINESKKIAERHR